ncbi:MAG: NAD(P)H-dependent glycerol-3-phosphate dehydrogenase [Gammaproteobacteria bacterium]
MTQVTIGVLGAGAWGTALAIHLAKLHPEIHLWARNSDALEEIISHKENKRYLPGSTLPDNIIASTDFATLVNHCTHVLVAVPSTTMRDMMQRINTHTSKNLRGIIWACKGLEQGSGKFLHQVAEEELTANINTAILSGPSFAQEVGKGLPTAVTIASVDETFANEVAQLFHHPLFRTYISTDVTGVEIGGTFKNILAIAAGIIDGLQFGANARAALITRGVAEMTRFGKRLDVNTDTFSGLSGIGDIVLTCTENMSRNRRFGLGLGAGKSLQQVEEEIDQVIEGKYAAKVVFDLAQKLDIELPISTQVYEVLYNDKPAREAVEELLSRSLKNEAD